MPQFTFTKMHGIGNDYVYVNAFQEKLPDDLPALAIAVSDRHKGIGADGLILIEPSNLADARMRMFNADGSESEMCGNGVRCVAKYVYDHAIAQKPTLTIETGAGVLTLDLTIENGLVTLVKVDMGEPILLSDAIPTKLPGDPPVFARLEVGGTTLEVTCVSMGNPHCITYVDKITNTHVHTLGPLVEKHDAFPRRVNAEFIEVLSRNEANMRVWERGSGETQACGTGACAVAVAGVLTGKTDRELLIHLPGGDLQLHWDEATNHVFMTGPATEVFTGTWIWG